MWHGVVLEQEIQPGKMIAREIGDLRIVLYSVNGEIFATNNVCTHAYALLSDGWLDDDVVECPLHGGQFNVRSGKALCDPVDRDLTTFPVRIQDGQIQILLPS